MRRGDRRRSIAAGTKGIGPRPPHGSRGRRRLWKRLPPGGRRLEFDASRRARSDLPPVLKQSDLPRPGLDPPARRVLHLVSHAAQRRTSGFCLTWRRRRIAVLGSCVDGHAPDSCTCFRITGTVLPALDLGDGSPRRAPSTSARPAQASVVDGYRRDRQHHRRALQRWQAAYGTEWTKDDVFFYVYGLLHSQDYRERYAADLKKMLPRIPLVATAQRRGRSPTPAGH